MTTPNTTRPRIAAAVVTYNKREAVLALLDRLAPSDIPAYVTANACKDGTADAIRERHPQVCLLDSEANLGGTGGFDCAVLAALTSGARYICLLDDDVMPAEGCLEGLADFLDAEPGYAWAVPAVYMSRPENTLQETGGDVDPDREPVIEAWNRFAPRPPSEEPLPIGYASACCLMIRAEHILRVGVMDWSFFLFFDDVDWCRRLEREAGPGVCVTTLSATHDFPWGKPFSAMRLYFQRRNELLFMAREERHDGRFGDAFRRSLRRLFISWIRAAAAGDAVMRKTLSTAFRHARAGRYGPPAEPLPSFAEHLTEFDAETFRARRIRRVLVCIRNEAFIDPVLERLADLAGETTPEIDLLCDHHRCDHWRADGRFRNVLGRAGDAKHRILEPFRLRRRGYDLSIEDVYAEPRCPNAMVGKTNCVYHDGALYRAPRRLFRSYAAFLLAPSAAKLLTRLFEGFRHDLPQTSPPPPEAATLLARIGADPAVGQPRNRFWPTNGVDAAVAAMAEEHSDAEERFDTVGGYDEFCAMERCEASGPPASADTAPEAPPCFSIVTPVCDPEPEWLRACVDSVRNQTTPEWELLLTDDASTREDVRAFLNELAEKDPRVTVLFRRERGGISRATNDGAAAARGRYIFFLDHDDMLHPDALRAFAECVDAGAGDGPAVVYGDEDRFDESGKRFWPGCKPRFCRRHLLTTNYLHHPVAVRRDLFEHVGGLRPEFDGSQDLDLLLRVIEADDTVAHVPRILYHMRVHEKSLASGPAGKPMAHERGRRAVAEAYRRTGVSCEVREEADVPGVFHPVFPWGADLRVGVVAVEKNVDGDSAALSEVWTDCAVRLVKADSRTADSVNRAVEEMSESDIVFIVDDRLRPRSPAWRTEVAPLASFDDAGCVTCRILDGDDRLVSAGLRVGPPCGLRNWCEYALADEPGYELWIRGIHEVSGFAPFFCACARTRFLNAGGLDARWRHGAAMMTDLALRMGEKEDVRHLSVGFTAMGLPVPIDAAVRADCALSPEDHQAFWERWGRRICGGDPAVSRNISPFDDQVRLLSPEETLLRAAGAGVAWDRPSAEVARRWWCSRPPE